MNNEQATTNREGHISHVVTDTTPKILAETILEMGALCHSQDRIIKELSADLNFIKEQYERADKLYHINKELTESVAQKGLQYDDARKINKQLVENHQYYMVKAKASVEYRDVIIDQLLEKYDISKQDRAKIKKLRASEAPVKQECSLTCPANMKPVSFFPSSVFPSYAKAE